MKIYMYLRRLSFGNEGPNDGLGKSAFGFCSALVRHGLDVTLLCEGEKSDPHRSANGFEVRSFEGACRNPFRVSPELIDSLKQDKPDLLILHGIFTPSLFTVHRVCRAEGIPYSVSPHDPYNSFMFRKSWYVKWPYWYLFEKPMLDSARLIQVLDRRHASLLARRGVATPIVEIMNGFEASDVLQRKPSFSEKEPFVFGYLGRLDRYNKGLDLLLEAAACFEDVKLVLQGRDCGDTGSLERKIESLALRDRVELKPPDLSRKPTEIISDWDVFCLASRYEGFGLVALEAMLARKPLIVSSVGGIAPHVEKAGAGLVCEPEVGSLRRAMQEMLSRREEWALLGEQGCSYALRNLSWDEIAKKAVEQFAGALKEPSRARHQRDEPLGAPARTLKRDR